MIELADARSRVASRDADLIAEILAPRERLTLSEYADRYRVIPPGTSPEPGRWRTRRVPYMREPMDACTDPEVREVVLMTGSQVAKTEVALTLCAYHVQLDPCSILVVLPSDRLAKTWSAKRFDRMIASTPELAGRVAPIRSRSSSNTMFEKDFPGGGIAFTGSATGRQVKSRPVRVLICDEVDEIAEAAIGQARARVANFWNRKTVLLSTPEIDGLSPIQAAYNASSQAQYWVPCLACGTLQLLTWERVRWERRDPATARIECEGCRERFDDAERIRMIAAGEWRHRFPELREVRGYHVSRIYSTFAELSQLVGEWLQAQGRREQLKVFVTHALGEPWREGESPEADRLESRLEDYAPRGEVPHDAAVLTLAIDVQDDRLEAQVDAWGADEESWLVEWLQLPGDPGHPDVWSAAAEILTRPYRHASGIELRIRGCVVDSGAWTQDVYRWVKAMRRRRLPVWASKGYGDPWRPLVGRISRSNRARVPLIPVGTVAAKDALYSRLKQPTSGPGYRHLPSWADSEYLEQLTAEVRVYSKGRRAYRKKRERNEALDLTVLGMVAHDALRVRAQIPALLEELNGSAAKPTRTTARRSRTGRSWVEDWRR